MTPVAVVIGSIDNKAAERDALASDLDRAERASGLQSLIKQGQEAIQRDGDQATDASGNRWTAVMASAQTEVNSLERQGINPRAKEMIAEFASDPDIHPIAAAVLPGTSGPAAESAADNPGSPGGWRITGEETGGIRQDYYTDAVDSALMSANVGSGGAIARGLYKGVLSGQLLTRTGLKNVSKSIPRNVGEEFPEFVGEQLIYAPGGHGLIPGKSEGFEYTGEVAAESAGLGWGKRGRRGGQTGTGSQTYRGGSGALPTQTAVPPGTYPYNDRGNFGTA